MSVVIFAACGGGGKVIDATSGATTATATSATTATTVAATATAATSATSVTSASTASSPATTATAPATTASPTTIAPTTTRATGESLSAPVPLDTFAQVGDGWMLRVTAYNPAATALIEAANQFNDPPPAGQVYVVIAIEVSYGGPKDKEFPFLSLNAVGASKKSYASFDTFAVPPDPSFNTTKDVFQGGTSSGNVVMAVDEADAAGLVIYASIGFGIDDVYFATS